MLPALSQDTRDIVVAISLECSGPGADIRSVSVSDNPLKFNLKLGNNSIGGNTLRRQFFRRNLRGIRRAGTTDELLQAGNDVRMRSQQRP
jgi:hypothetical protein